MVWGETWQDLHNGDGAIDLFFFEGFTKRLEAGKVCVDGCVGVTVAGINEAAAKEGIGKNNQMLAFDGIVFEPLPQGFAVGIGGEAVHAFFSRQVQWGVQFSCQKGRILGVARATIQGHERHRWLGLGGATACKGAAYQGYTQQGGKYDTPFFHGNLS